MKMYNTVKRMVALGAGASMIGATMMGAMAAADLASYPAPFVKDGKFNAVLVVGDAANAADVVGSIEVASSLQAGVTVKKTINVDGAASSTTIDDGVKVSTSSSKLRITKALNTVKNFLTETELPTLLKASKVTDEEGDDYDVKTKIQTGNAYVSFDKSILDTDNPELVLVYDGSKKYNTTIEFSPAINASLAHDQAITLFGNTYTLGTESEMDSNTVVLYKAAIDQTFSAGEIKTVDVGGTSISVEVIGVNTQSDPATATIVVNGESKSVSQGNTYTIGSQRVYVKDVFAYTAPVASGAVRLFLGANKMTLNHGENVQLGTSNTQVDGTNVLITNSGSKISKIVIEVTPDTFEDSVEAIQVGKELVDPVFGTFKFLLAGGVPPLDDAGREMTSLYTTSDDRMKLKFTNKDGNQCDLEFVRPGATTTPYTSNKFLLRYNDNNNFTVTSTQKTYKGGVFVVTNSEYSRILKLNTIRNSTDAHTITVQDVCSGDSWDEDYTPAAGATTGTIGLNGNDVTFTLIGAKTPNDAYITIGATNILYTNKGMEIQLPTAGISGTFNATNGTIVFTEETSYNDAGTPDNHGKLNLTLRYQDGNDGSDMFFSAAPTYASLGGAMGTVTSALSAQMGDSGDTYGMVTPYGTYVKYTVGSSESNKVELSYFGDETSYDVYVAPTGAQTKTVEAGAGTITYEEVVPIEVGYAKLASEVADVKALNAIVIGGPCANAAAAKLMGNPVDCAAGFEPGKGKIKLFENMDKVSMLVAGYTADDTRRASRVISKYKTYAGQLKGMEVEVSGTSFADIKVSTPTVA